MKERPDIAVYSTDQNPTLVVEVKGKHNASEEWVIQMRSNLIAHAVIPSSQYFLLALPDYFYLWTDNISANRERAPDYQIETKQVIGRYIGDESISLNDISEQGLELLVTSWLKDLAISDAGKLKTNPSLQWLIESGLYQSIKNGSVQVDAAA